MANGKTPETEGEHIIAIYGHIEGLKKGHDEFAKDMGRVEGKLDKFESYLVDIHKKLDNKFTTMYWWIVAGIGLVTVTILGLLKI
jgi:hypothetical protein